MLHHDLLSIEEGQAQFSVKIPESSHAISVAKLFINLKRKHDAIFIGYAPNGLVKEIGKPTVGRYVKPGRHFVLHC